MEKTVTECVPILYLNICFVIKIC